MTARSAPSVRSTPHIQGMSSPWRRFSARCSTCPAPVAQGIERRFPKPCVAGSNPAGGAMCLLIVLTRTHGEMPLVVGANRDELLERPAVPLAVLRDANPRIVGGRDELAGGTWRAVNDAGVGARPTHPPTTQGPA